MKPKASGNLTLINLIGAQPMPNLIPIWQYPPKRVLLIASEDAQRVAGNLETLCRDRGIGVRTEIGASAFDFEALQQKLMMLSRMLSQSINPSAHWPIPEQQPCD